MNSPSYPRWHSTPADARNLREIEAGLFIGAEDAVQANAWHTVIDLYGNMGDPAKSWRYRNIPNALSFPFPDGQVFPPGALTHIREAYLTARDPVLIHCRAGLSQSASAGYAMIRSQFGLSHETTLARVTTPSHTHQYPLAVTLRSAREWVHRHRTDRMPMR